MGEVLELRRGSVATRLETLRAALGEASSAAAGRACVYVTGSFGRGEASTYSDLDLFIVGLGESEQTRKLSRLDEILIKAALIRVARQHKFPEFSGDGRYLEHHTIGALVETLGTPDDDRTNTFTARLLLLLESRPLIESDVHSTALSSAISAYWRDYHDHSDRFVPAFLVNDILRLWRTFCVNYEARTQTEPPREKAKRKLKNYKLKHSRLMTCYSAISHLLAIFSETGTITEADAKLMSERTPTERVERLTDWNPGKRARSQISKVVGLYERFLSETDAAEEDLLERFLDRNRSSGYQREAKELGDAMVELLEAVGGRSDLYRLLLV